MCNVQKGGAKHSHMMTSFIFEHLLKQWFIRWIQLYFNVVIAALSSLTQGKVFQIASTDFPLIRYLPSFPNVTSSTVAPT